MKLLINNVEQRQDRNADTLEILLYGRSPDDPTDRKEIVVEGFRPYFYAPENEVRDNENEILSGPATEVQYDTNDALRGETLAKVYVSKPQDVREMKGWFSQTYAADVPFVNRFMIDTGVRSYVDVPAKRCHWREVEAIE